MISADTAFEQILENIEPVLFQNGFREIERESHPEAFGSCYVQFSNGKEVIRFVWDGREYWFVVESLLAELAESFGDWTEILLRRFDLRNEKDETVAVIANDMKMALTGYFRNK